MRLEFINRVRENDVLGKSIFTNDGSVLLRAGVKLTNQYIERLKKIGVVHLYISDYRLEDIAVEDERIIKMKQETIKSINNISKSIHGYKQFKIEDSLKSIENLMEYIIQDGDVNKNLYEIKTYDNYTYMHCVDTGIMCAFLGSSLKFNEYDIKELGKGAILHDVGKTKIPYEIINKKGPLTDEEFYQIKKHPVYGKNILQQNFNISESVLKCIEQHHEKINGSGYPYGLSGNEISKFGKVVCVCDVYDAVSNNRSYRKRFNPNDAYELILGGSGSLFDKNIVKKFKETFAIYSLGTCVKLSNGIEGYVVKQNKGFPDRPVIRVIYEAITKERIPFYELDLLEHLDITIKSIV